MQIQRAQQRIGVASGQLHAGLGLAQRGDVGANLHEADDLVVSIKLGLDFGVNPVLAAVFCTIHHFNPAYGARSLCVQ